MEKRAIEVSVVTLSESESIRMEKSSWHLYFRIRISFALASVSATAEYVQSVSSFIHLFFCRPMIPMKMINYNVELHKYFWLPYFQSISASTTTLHAFNDDENKEKL